MFKNDIQSLNVGAFMDGMLSVFCTLRPSFLENGEFNLEVTVTNEGDKALRNFNLIIDSTHGFKFRNARDIFRVSQISENIKFLRAQQSVVFNIVTKRDLEFAGCEITVTAVTAKGIVPQSSLPVQVLDNPNLQISA